MIKYMNIWTHWFEITGNKGLISVDRNTRLLYHLQYPVPIKSSTKDFKASKIWNCYSARVRPLDVSRSNERAAPMSSMIRGREAYPYTL